MPSTASWVDRMTVDLRVGFPIMSGRSLIFFPRGPKRLSESLVDLARQDGGS